MLARYEAYQKQHSPYGYGDTMKYYYLIDYWEERLKTE